MTVSPHFEEKDIRAIRGLVYDELNKIPLNEDLKIVKTTLKALIKRQTPNSNLSFTFATRVRVIQEIIDDPSFWGISPDKTEAFHQLVFECLQEKIIFFKEKQKQLLDLTKNFEQQMLSKIENELIWIPPEKLFRVGERIKSEALKQARYELSNSQRIEAEIALKRHKELQDKIKELGARIPSTEKFYESVKRQFEEGRIGGEWSMESLFGHESVITHYLVEDQILSKQSFLSLKVFEFVQFGSEWLKPIYTFK